jgi:histidinol-phosphatase (PHP family)
MRLDQLDEYVEMVRQTRTQFPQLTIRLALEIDYLPDQEDWIRELLRRHPWDYCIGSVHYVRPGWDIDNPAKLAEWKKRTPIEVWTLYFDRLTQAAASGLFQIIGHVDLPKKFCYYPSEDRLPLYRQFIAAAQKAGVAVELNTAGLRKECREIYPCRALLELAVAAGIPITFGSDAHAPEEVGLNFPEAIQLAKAVGYTCSCRFVQRERQWLSL